MFSRTFAGAVLATALVACSSIPRQERDHEELDRYLKYSGDPVDRITYFGRYDGWQSIGSDRLILWTTPNDAYLITVRQPCTDLPFVQTIGVTHTSSTVYSRLDSVLVRNWKCPIAEIRPVDYRRMRADIRAEREAKKAADSTARTPPDAAAK
jgi:Family of unknown function (DUF6491)